MRNLKRALSLGLTAAMISGLMVMGSSAASYADVTSEDNVEAIEVLQTVGIMVGDENGDFNPDQNVTRNEMAVIMSNLMEYNVASYKDTSPFTDVPSWAEPYVAACWTNGITSGYNATTYGGSDSVTTAQAALMLMKALGYFQYSSDFGSDWQLSAVKQGNAIDLFMGVDSGVEQAMTRNDVAQLVLNTLEAGTVQAETDGSLTVGNVTIATDVKYNYITSNQGYATAIDDARSTSNTTDAGRAIVELGEQLYMGDLELNDNTTDVFGRPSRTWTYDNKEIGTYAKTELLKETYTQKVTGRELYDLLGSNVVDNYDLTVTIDGVTDHDIDGAIFNWSSVNRNNKAGVGETGNGVLTQVYVDQENKDVHIAIINTYLAIAADDYNEKQEEVSLEVYGVDLIDGEYVKTIRDGEDKETLEVSNDDIDVSEVLEDDVMLVTLADGEVQSIADPETLSAVEISSFKVGDSLTVDGTDYDYADAAEYDVETLERWTDGNTINLKDMTYNVYLDQYGYAIGVVEVEEPDNYLFITGLDGNYNNLANATYEANAIFMDGTMEVITIDSRKSDFDPHMDVDGDGEVDDSILVGDEDDATVNAWFTYTVNSKDVYTVKLVDINAGLDEVGQSVEDRGDGTENDIIDYKHDSTTDGAGNRVYGNDETVYLTASIDEIKTGAERTDVVIDDVDSVVVGIDNVDIQPWDEETVREDYADAEEVSSGIYTLYDEDGYIIAMVVVGEDNGANDALVYIHEDSVERESYDKTTEEWTWTRTAVDGATGEEITLTEVDDSGISMLDDMDEGKWYRVRFNADGEVTRVGSDNADVDSDERPDYDNDFDDFWDLFDNDRNTYAGPANVPYAYVYEHNNNAINTAINIDGVDTVLYHEIFGADDKPTNSGKTLYVTQDHDAYIRFTDDTVVVFEQENNNEWTTEFWAGQSGVERALRELRVTAEGYSISALIENGRAATIVIYDGSPDGNDGAWTDENMVTNGNEMFRLWGTDNAEAEAIAYNYSNGYVNYSFYAFDDVDDDGDLERVPNGVEVKYELRVESKNDYIGTWEFTSKTAAGREGAGLIDGEFKLANHDEVVDIYVRNVSVVDEVDEEVTLTLDLSNVRLNIGNKAYSNGDTLKVEAGSVITATILPTSDAVKNNMVLDTDTLSAGAGNDITVDGTAVTIIADVNGTVVVDYIADTYEVDIQAGTLSGWALDNDTTEKQGGTTFTFTLTQNTAADKDEATVTLTGLDASAYTYEVTTPGVTEANAVYETKQFTSVSEFAEAVAAGTLYVDNENDEDDGIKATLDDYATGTDFYILKTPYVAPVQAVITVTVTMPNADVTVTDITVA